MRLWCSFRYARWDRRTTGNMMMAATSETDRRLVSGSCLARRSLPEWGYRCSGSSLVSDLH